MVILMCLIGFFTLLEEVSVKPPRLSIWVKIFLLVMCCPIPLYLVCIWLYLHQSFLCHFHFPGFNSTLREGNVTHHEYIQVGKGRDVGLNQISMFEAKIANGNGEQTLSRDIYRLGHRFDFFRMMSCYFTTVGFYFSTLVCYCQS